MSQYNQFCKSCGNQIKSTQRDEGNDEIIESRNHYQVQLKEQRLKNDRNFIQSFHRYDDSYQNENLESLQNNISSRHNIKQSSYSSANLQLRAIYDELKNKQSSQQQQQQQYEQKQVTSDNNKDYFEKLLKKEDEKINILQQLYKQQTYYEQQLYKQQKYYEQQLKKSDEQLDTLKQNLVDVQIYYSQRLKDRQNFYQQRLEEEKYQNKKTLEKYQKGIDDQLKATKNYFNQKQPYDHSITLNDIKETVLDQSRFFYEYDNRSQFLKGKPKR